MTVSTVYRPGRTVPISGIYAEVDQYVRPVGRNVTCVKWEPFPPTRKGGDGYILIQATNP
jgi:hypothetical protein